MQKLAAREAFPPDANNLTLQLSLYPNRVPFRGNHALLAHRRESPKFFGRHLFYLLALIAITAFAPLSHAQPGPPNIQPATDQWIPGVDVHSGVGNFSVGFQAEQNRFFIVSSEPRTGFIKVNLLGTNGTSIGTPQVISADVGVFPVVSKDAVSKDVDGLPVVAWVKTDRELQELRLRVLNNDGSPNGPEVTADVGDSNSQILNLALTRYRHNSSDYLLTWSKNKKVFGRILDISNVRNPFKTATFAISGDGGEAIGPSSVFDYTQGLYLVVYGYLTSESTGVFGQLVTNNGELVGGAFRITTHLIECVGSPKVAFSPEAPDGRLLVVWETCDATALKIVGQRVDITVPPMGARTLSLVGGRIDVSQTPEADGNVRAQDRSHDLVYSPTLGQYLVTWNRFLAGVGSETMGRLINFDGTMPRATFKISASSIAEGEGSDARAAWSEVITKVAQHDGSLIPNRFEYIALWRGNFGHMRFRFVDPHLDSDGDALMDDWETGGADLNNDGQIDTTNDINLLTLEPNNPPNHLRKDVYLEIDWEDCALGGCAPGVTQNHRLLDLDGNNVPDIVEQMVAAFARDHSPANVRNPDGSNGITLHVDYGQLGGGNAIAANAALPRYSVQTVSLSNLDRRRKRIFHYCLSVHSRGSGADKPGQGFTAGGGGTEMNLNDVIRIASSTFMHELGHTFALAHGGVDDVLDKPNYLSVMNYSFSFWACVGLTQTNLCGGIPVVGGGTPLLDFSTRVLLDLDEARLNESAGVGLTQSNLQTIFRCPNGMLTTQNADGAIDWNCNGRIDTSSVSVDLNGDGVLDTLKTGDDWSRMFYNFRAVGNYTAPPPA